jgi:hypothetical protein
MHRSMLPALMLVAACNEYGRVVAQTKTETWQQAPTDEVDILFVVDSSGSMAQEQALLSAGFTSFISTIADSNTDFHIGVIDTDMDFDTATRGQLRGEPTVITGNDNYVALFQSRVIVGTSGSGREKGLEAALFALSPTMTTGVNAGFLRPTANLLVVFVSDEDDCSDDGRLGPDADNLLCYSDRAKLTPVPSLVGQFQALKASKDMVTLAAIVGPDETASEACDENTLPGARYVEAARLTGGLTSSICESDWSDFLFELGLSATGIFSTFQLSHGAQPGTLDVTIDGAEVPFLGYVGTDLGSSYDPVVTRDAASVLDGYVYDVDNKVLEFFNAWIPERGSSVKATYTIEPGT